MNKRKLWTLIAGAGLAAMALLLVFLLFGRSTVRATLNEDDAVLDLRSPDAPFTVSGTVTCKATGPIAGVEVSAWDQLRSSVVASDSTDSSGVYSVTLDEGTYYLELVPPATTELNARAFTTTGIVTDTTLDVNFCVCSSVWVSETVDNAANVGTDTSLALAPTYPYTPHISYHDITSDTLKYTYLSRTVWHSQTVDSGGRPTSLALVPTYPHTPCIGYHDYWGWALKYACRDDITWSIETVSGGMRVGHNSTSLALEPTLPHLPHISAFNPWGTIGTLYHSTYSGTWMHEPIEPALSEVGWWSSLGLERTYPYTPHVSYYDHSNGDLKHAWKNGTTWLTETVDSTGNVGWYTSLALDSRGSAHISYFDDTNDALKYAWESGTTWLSDTVDSTGQPDWGSGTTSLELDESDRPYISYYDATDGNLKLARFDGRVWIIQTADSGGNVGQYSSLALDTMGCSHISYYDVTHGDLKYAYIPPHYLYLPLAMRNYP
jgi:hypothetical protein